MIIYIVYGNDGYNNTVVDKAFMHYSKAIDYVVKNLLAHYKNEDDDKRKKTAAKYVEEIDVEE